MDYQKDLIEETFCLRYELETLANVVLRQESERWVPGFLFSQTEHSHLERYKLACNYSKNKKVIDIASGSGKGSNLIATLGNALVVNGFDIQPDAVRYAKWRYPADNVEYLLGDAEKLNFDSEFDLAISFETVEHLSNFELFLSGIKNCLKTNGLFLISTPISAKSIDKKPANPYHVQEWGFVEFQNVIKEFFSVEQVYVQLYPKQAPIIRQIRKPLIKRIFNRIKRELSTEPGLTIEVSTEDLVGDGFSIMEEYTGQYAIDELGSVRSGYQIVLAKKN